MIMKFQPEALLRCVVSASITLATSMRLWRLESLLSSGDTSGFMRNVRLCGLFSCRLGEKSVDWLPHTPNDHVSHLNLVFKRPRQQKANIDTPPLLLSISELARRALSALDAVRSVSLKFYIALSVVCPGLPHVRVRFLR